MKVKFDQLARKYNRDLVFEVWVHVVTGQIMRNYFHRWGWDSQMTIAQGLDHLDDFINSIEYLIQEYQSVKRVPGIISYEGRSKSEMAALKKSDSYSKRP